MAEAPRWPDWVETWVFPFLRERALWPVLVAILGHVVLLFALGLLELMRGTGWWAAVLSIGGTVALVGLELRIQRRPGAIALALGATWLVAAATVALALRTGFL